MSCNGASLDSTRRTTPTRRLNSDRPSFSVFPDYHRWNRGPTHGHPGASGAEGTAGEEGANYELSPGPMVEQTDDHEGGAGVRGVGTNVVSAGAPPQGEEAEVSEVFLVYLLAEAYLVNVGTWLARYEKESVRQRLGERIVLPEPRGYEGLPQDQWEWLTSLLPALG